jgi:hypothetical protein
MKKLEKEILKLDRFLKEYSRDKSSRSYQLLVENLKRKKILYIEEKYSRAAIEIFDIMSWVK